MEFLEGETIAGTVDDLLDDVADYRSRKQAAFHDTADDDKEDFNLDTGHQMELKRLHMTEEKLQNENNEIESNRKLVKDLTRAEVNKMVKAAEDARRKTEENKNLTKEFRNQKQIFKEEEKNMILMTQTITSANAYPKLILEKFLKVSPDGRCTDKEFCRIFSGGKCNCTLQRME